MVSATGGRQDTRRWLIPSVAVAAGTAILCVGLVAAQERTTQETAEALRADIEDRFDVLRLSGGVGLVPRNRTSDIALIEVRDRSVAVDGSPVSGQELGARIGADADLILQLTYLSPDALLSLFGFTSGVAVVEEPGAREVPEVQPDPDPESRPGIPVRRTSGSDVFRLGGSVRIAEDEIIRGDVVVIGGSLTVDGEVTGDVVVVGGPARFGSDAEVRGDVTIVGGPLQRSATAQLRGSVNQIGIGDVDFSHFSWPRFRVRPVPPWRFSQVLDFGGTVVRLLFVGLLGCLALFAARGTVERIARRAAAEPVKAGLVGFITELLFFPVLILGILILVISIIGIPLLVLVPFVLIASIIVLIVGFAGIAHGLGQWTLGRLGRGGVGVYVSMWIGVTLILAATLTGEILDLAGGLFGVIATTLAIAGFFVEYAAWTTGLGAVILNRFAPASSTMPASYIGSPAPASPPPPPPPLPEVQ